MIPKGSIRIYDPQLGRDRFVQPKFDNDSTVRYIGHSLADYVGKLGKVLRYRVGPLKGGFQYEIYFPPKALAYWVLERDLELIDPAAPVTLADAMNAELVAELARRLG